MCDRLFIGGLANYLAERYVVGAIDYAIAVLAGLIGTVVLAFIRGFPLSIPFKITL